MIPGWGKELWLGGAPENMAIRVGSNTIATIVARTISIPMGMSKVWPGAKPGSTNSPTTGFAAPLLILLSNVEPLFLAMRSVVLSADVVPMAAHSNRLKDCFGRLVRFDYYREVFLDRHAIFLTG